VTKFFLGGGDCDDAGREDAYAELRERSHSVVGCAATPRRIFKLDCRFEGSDQEIKVGGHLPDGTDLVVAILDHGREESYAVHTANSQDAPTRVTRPAYAVTDFS
jgi:hypothetical protein